MESSGEKVEGEGGLEERLDCSCPPCPTRSLIRGDKGMQSWRHVQAKFGRGEGNRPMVLIVGAGAV
eukprot:3931387-Pleurochrysis_carterae.AAC.1